MIYLTMWCLSSDFLIFVTITVVLIFRLNDATSLQGKVHFVFLKFVFVQCLIALIFYVLFRCCNFSLILVCVVSTVAFYVDRNIYANNSDTFLPIDGKFESAYLLNLGILFVKPIIEESLKTTFESFRTRDPIELKNLHVRILGVKVEKRRRSELWDGYSEGNCSVYFRFKCLYYGAIEYDNLPFGFEAGIKNILISGTVGILANTKRKAPFISKPLRCRFLDDLSMNYTLTGCARILNALAPQARVCYLVRTASNVVLDDLLQGNC